MAVYEGGKQHHGRTSDEQPEKREGEVTEVCLIAFKLLNGLSPANLQNILIYKLPNIENDTRILRSTATLDCYKVGLPKHEDTLKYKLESVTSS